MKGKKILIAIALFAGMALALFLAWKYRVNRTVNDMVGSASFKKEGKGLGKLINPGDIIQIKIRNPNENITLEKKESGEWILTEPLRSRANFRSVSSLPKKLASIQENRIIEENPADLTKYMLDKPDIVVQFLVKGDQKWHSILFGRRAPTGDGYYTMNPDNGKVFLTDFDIKFDFNGGHDLYINKFLLENNPRGSNRAVFEFPDIVYEFAFDSKAQYWFMEKPSKAKAHARKFTATLGWMAHYEAMRVIDPSTAPQDTGLDNPKIKLTFSKTGEYMETILIGGNSPDGGFYAKKAESPLIYILPADFLDGLKAKLKDISTTFSIWFARDHVKRIEFIRGDQSIVFTRESKGGTWKLAGQEGAIVDEGALGEIIYKIHSTKNRGYVDASMPEAASQYGLDKPRMVVKLDFLSDKMPPLTLYYGNTDPSGRYIYTYNSEDPYILKVDSEYLKIIPNSAKTLLR